MGLFDGKSGDSEAGSSAEIAKLLKLPVVLVVDAGKSAQERGRGRTGLRDFDPELTLAGVILNRVGGERHFAMLKVAIASRCKTDVLGWLPREPAIAIPERHLGLHTAEESAERGLRELRLQSRSRPWKLWRRSISILTACHASNAASKLPLLRCLFSI